MDDDRPKSARSVRRNPDHVVDTLVRSISICRDQQNREVEIDNSYRITPREYQARVAIETKHGAKHDGVEVRTP